MIFPPALTTIAEGEYKRALLRDPCAYCGRHGADVLDHIVARARGGENRWTNYTGACNGCNYSKRATPLLSFLLPRNRQDGRPILP